MREQNSQFKKDVLKAKAKYRKRRKFIILAIMTFALAVTLLQTFLYIRDKKQINAQLAEQNQMIENLDKENKVNELVIDKLKDPYSCLTKSVIKYGSFSLSMTSSFTLFSLSRFSII